MKNKPTVPEAIAQARARIREAEKRMDPVTRETVGVDAESYDSLATLVERKVGKRPEVLRQALATGLRVMLQGSSVEPAGAGRFDYYDSQYTIDERNEAPPEDHRGDVALPELGPLASAALGIVRTTAGAPILERPSGRPVDDADALEE